MAFLLETAIISLKVNFGYRSITANFERRISFREISYSGMQSDGNSFCGYVHLDSFNMVYSEKAVRDDISAKNCSNVIASHCNMS